MDTVISHLDISVGVLLPFPCGKNPTEHQTVGSDFILFKRGTFQFIGLKILNAGLAYRVKWTKMRNIFPSACFLTNYLMESDLQQGYVPNTLQLIEDFPLILLNFGDPKEYYSSKKLLLYNGLKFFLAVNVF